MSQISDEKLIEMLKTLPKVKAPEDFQFRLKARILKVGQKRKKMILSYAFVFVLIMFTFVALFVVLRVDRVKDLQVESLEEYAENLESLKVNEQIANTQESKTAYSVQREVSERKVNYQTREESVKSVNTKSLSSVSNKLKSQHFRDKTQFSVVEVLSQIGIEVAVETEGVRIKSIKNDSIAERLGMKVGDLIVSINDHKLDKKEIKAEKVEIRKITVKRLSEEISFNCCF
ncbi:MAG: PDZ domain-containing protein [Pyrinomonadaceae bacterium]|nr:PDZ domain-containing protein [Pyrinomonadaceae bacterium]MCX7640089.1 PDZ domain-containing protein [Pyrinomonadaceae bacterium]MDW8304261.1 PDZ domain-containing protein [Acidobacteriota bacterium]